MYSSMTYHRLMNKENSELYIDTDKLEDALHGYIKCRSELEFREKEVQEGYIEMAHDVIRESGSNKSDLQLLDQAKELDIELDIMPIISEVYTGEEYTKDSLSYVLKTAFSAPLTDQVYQLSDKLRNALIQGVELAIERLEKKSEFNRGKIAGIIDSFEGGNQ